MPGKSNSQNKKGKGLSRNDQRGLAANTKMMNAVMSEGIDENSMRFGKVTKMVGNSRVEVIMSDGRDTNALIRDVLRAKGSCGIGVGSVVLLGLPDWEKDLASEASGLKPVSYVEGIVNTKKVMDFLRERGDIPERFFVDMSEGGKAAEPAFEFVAAGDDDDEEEGEEAVAAAELAMEATATATVGVATVGGAASAAGGAGAKNTVIKDKRVTSAAKHGGYKPSANDDESPFDFE